MGPQRAKHSHKGQYRTIQEYLGPYLAILDYTGPYGAIRGIWNLMKLYMTGAIQVHTEPYRAIQGPCRVIQGNIGPYGAICDRTGQ